MATELKNMFTEGWRVDNEPSLQSPNSVRDLLNMRILSVTNNTYALESIKGTKLSFSLNPGYFPIGWCRLANRVIIASTKNINGVNTNGEIGSLIINHDTYIGTYTPIYNHQELTFNASHQIECWGYRENDFIERFYWTDFYNTFRAINVALPIFSNYIAVGSLVVSQRYMVLRGIVTNNAGADDYGPAESLGSVFTALGDESYSVGTIVIEYYNINQIDVVPTRDQGNITFNRWLPGGNLLSGGWQYCYQLFSIDGTQSNFSYVSMPFHVGGVPNPGASSVDYQAFQGGAFNANSQKGQRIDIDNIDTSFSKIRVVAIHDTSNIAADPPEIIYDGAITGPIMSFDHLGNENLGTLTAADLEAVVLALRRFRTGAILKKRFFMGDVDLSPFVPFDNTGATAETFGYLFPSDVVGRPDSSTNAGNKGMGAHTLADESGVSVIYTDQWYKVSGTGQVEYPVASATFYNPDDVFQGITGGVNNHSFTVVSGSPIIKAIFRIQLYTGVYRDITVNDDWLDTKGPVNATHMRSHWRKEKYRYGFLVYDPFENPLYVQWILDKTIPSQYATTDPDSGNPLTYDPRLAEEYLDDFGAGNVPVCNLRNIGVRFSGLDFGAIATALGVTISDLPKYIGGFSIVRAPRDAQILCQGVLQACGDAAGDTHPISAPSVAQDKWGAVARRSNSYTFYSPEFEFQKFGLPNVISGDELEIQSYYTDDHMALAGVGTLETNNYHYYQKLYAWYDGVAAGFPAPGSKNFLDLSKSFPVTVGETSHIIGSGPGAFQNNSATAGFLFGTERSCTGSNAYFFFTGYDETGSVYPSTGYVSDNESRAIINFVRPKGNLYGGTSDAALANTQYLFCGHYQPMDAAFIAYLNGNAGIADDIEVFGGDCFVSIFDIARMINPDGSGGGGDRSSFGMAFPVESNINLSLREGRHLFRDRTYDAPPDDVNVNGICFASPPQVEEFVYNVAYSYEDAQFLYPALPQDFIPNGKFERRVYVSPMKIDGELIDSFRIFPVNDYLDLEGQNGELVNLRAKDSRLFYWQERAVGYIPVEERTTIADALGSPISIGTGGVLDRYDDIKQFFGNQHQFGLVETEDSFLWPDKNRKAMCTMSTGGGVVKLSTVLGLRSFFDQILTSEMSGDNPVRNQGIAGAYNSRFEEALFSFRRPVVSGSDYVPGAYMISYNNTGKIFAGKFSLQPAIMLEFDNILLMSYVVEFPAIQDLTVYVLGSRVNEGTATYTCILGYTSASTAIVPSVDTTHWIKITDINEVHIGDVGDVCKFFGYVDNSYVVPILNAPDEKDNVVFDNMSAHANPEFFDQASYSNSYQSETEAIEGNDQYEYLNRSWYWSVPFARDGDRFRDHYLQLQLDKNNRVDGSPITSKNQRVRLVSLTITMRKTL